MQLPADAEKLIPQRDKMKFLPVLTEWSYDGAASPVALTQNIFTAADGTLNPMAYPELIAQLCAASTGYRAIIEGLGPQLGLLVGLSNFEIHRRVVSDAEIRVEQAVDSEVPPVSFVTGKIFENGEALCGGTVKLWELDAAGNEFPRGTDSDPEPARAGGLPGEEFSDGSEVEEGILSSLYGFSSEGPRGEAVCWFDDDFAGFQGHFPGNPILPGVCIMTAAKMAASMVHGVPLEVKAVKMSKFANLVFPRQEIRFAVSLKEKDGGISAQVQARRGETLMAKFILKTEAVQ